MPKKDQATEKFVRYTRRYKYEISSRKGSKMLISRKKRSGNEIQSNNETSPEMKSKTNNLKIKNCFVLLTPLKTRDHSITRNDSIDNSKPVQNESEFSPQNVSINSTLPEQISIINVDDISEDDLMEVIDLTSPEKPVSENLPLHHKKIMLKKFLAEENATVFSLSYGLEHQGAIELGASAEHLLDDEDLNFSIDHLIQQLDEYEMNNLSGVFGTLASLN